MPYAIFRNLYNVHIYSLGFLPPSGFLSSKTIPVFRAPVPAQAMAHANARKVTSASCVVNVPPTTSLRSKMNLLLLVKVRQGPGLI